MVAPISGRIPDPADMDDEAQREATVRALEYMDLKAGMAILLAGGLLINLTL